jgi:hypothetical protein
MQKNSMPRKRSEEKVNRRMIVANFLKENFAYWLELSAVLAAKMLCFKRRDLSGGGCKTCPYYDFLSQFVPDRKGPVTTALKYLQVYEQPRPASSPALPSRPSGPWTNPAHLIKLFC